MIYSNAKFLKSAAKLIQLPDDEGREVAFAGRSNAGKSSGMNVITGLKGLARISKTPGRTQLINIFELDDKHRLVDLPGYGYAKVSEEIKARWQHTLGQYLQKRTCLCGLILFMDVRHPLKDMDLSMIDWAAKSHLPVHILLTKSDKLSRGAASSTLHTVRKASEGYTHISVQLFSALKKTGVDAAREKLDEWLYLKGLCGEK
ncbi:MAG: ribosome biogenesis GTP-binding protein YihA/YsxC [Gammaproteobacteria bacterium]